jgi:hypothetical protein
LVILGSPPSCFLFPPPSRIFLPTRRCIHYCRE